MSVCVYLSTMDGLRRCALTLYVLATCVPLHAEGKQVIRGMFCNLWQGNEWMSRDLKKNWKEILSLKWETSRMSDIKELQLSMSLVLFLNCLQLRKRPCYATGVWHLLQGFEQSPFHDLKVCLKLNQPTFGDVVLWGTHGCAVFSCMSVLWFSLLNDQAFLKQKLTSGRESNDTLRTLHGDGKRRELVQKSSSNPKIEQFTSPPARKGKPESIKFRIKWLWPVWPA